MRVALDTNVLIYLDAAAEDERRKKAADLLRHIPAEDTLLPVQVLAEYYRVLTQKQGYAASEAREMLIVWIDTYEAIQTTSDIVLTAADLTSAGHVSYWDAVVLASAASAGCRLLISEDMGNEFSWAGITVVNPFAEPRHPLLELVLQR